MSTIVTKMESLDAQFTKYDKILIPQYQRSYAWDGNDVQTFWQDIIDSIEEERDRYFIGPIVSKPFNNKSIELIDGQQRMTTSLALISIIRRICLNEFERDKDNNREFYDFYGILKNRFFVSSSLVSNNGQPRYVMNEENSYVYDNFIAEDVQKEEIEAAKKGKRKTDSNYKLLDCLSTLWMCIDEYAQSDLEVLRNISVYVLEKLDVLNISVSDESDAYLIFETINDRGRELDTMDLLKNHIFSKVSSPQFDSVKNNWIRMSENLRSLNNSNDFLYNFWVSYYGKVSKQNLFESIKKKVNNNSKNAYDLSRNLLECSKVYLAINNPENDFWNGFPNEVRENLKIMRELGAKAVTPILLSSVSKLDQIEFKKLLDYLIVFQVRYVLISDYHTGKYSNAISKVPSKTHKGEMNKAIKIARFLKSEGVYVNDQEFRDAFSSFTCSTKKAKFILSNIEQYETNSLKVTNANGAVVNIEHILPQTPCQEWPESYTGISSSEYATWAESLGNMVLSSSALNAAVKRSGFPTKKKELIMKSEDFRTTYILKDNDKWTKEEIRARQIELAEKANQVWSINFQ